MTETTIETTETKRADVPEVTLDQLPMHKLKSMLKAKGIQFRNTDSKDSLIKMLRTGETIHAAKEVKRAPVLKPAAKKPVLAIMPEEIMPELERLAQRGLTWKISEAEGVVRFMRDLPTTANLDQDASNILRTAKAAFAGRRPTERGRDANTEYAFGII
jgi:hypothetical protein